MYVAAARISLHLPSSQSLKDRRRILRSLIERTANRFRTAIAEVGGQDTWQVAEIGLSIVSSTDTHAREVVDEVIRFVEQFSPEAIVTRIDVDVIPFED